MSVTKRDEGAGSANERLLCWKYDGVRNCIDRASDTFPPDLGTTEISHRSSQLLLCHPNPLESACHGTPNQHTGSVFILLLVKIPAFKAEPMEDASPRKKGTMGDIVGVLTPCLNQLQDQQTLPLCGTCT